MKLQKIMLSIILVAAPLFPLSPAFSEELSTYVSSPDWEYKRLKANSLTVTAECNATACDEANAGQMCYDPGKDMKYCNGTSWIGLAKVRPAPTGQIIAHAILDRDTIINLPASGSEADGDIPGWKWVVGPPDGYSEGWKWKIGLPPNPEQPPGTSKIGHLISSSAPAAAPPHVAFHLDLRTIPDDYYTIYFRGDVAVDGGWINNPRQPLLELKFQGSNVKYPQGTGVVVLWSTHYDWEDLVDNLNNAPKSFPGEPNSNVPPGTEYFVDPLKYTSYRIADEGDDFLAYVTYVKQEILSNQQWKRVQIGFRRNTATGPAMKVRVRGQNDAAGTPHAPSDEIIPFEILIARGREASK